MAHAMIEWEEHGIVKITFDTDDGDVVVELRRPKLAQFSHFNESAAIFSQEELDLQEELTNDDSLSDADRRIKRLSRLGEDCVRWWDVVFNGDDHVKGLARTPVPAREDYPLDLIVPGNIARTTSHWLLPLVPGQTPELPETSTLPSNGLSTAPLST